jgi:hypothetical protein
MERTPRNKRIAEKPIFDDVIAAPIKTQEFWDMALRRIEDSCKLLSNIRFLIIYSASGIIV